MTLISQKQIYRLKLCALLMVVMPIHGPTHASANEQSHVLTVNASIVEQETIKVQIPISGTLVAREMVLVNPLVTGYQITVQHSDVGDIVKKGDVLLELDDKTLKAQLAQADAEVLRAKAALGQAENQVISANGRLTQTLGALQRTQKLKKSGNASQSTLDQAIASESDARAALAVAQNGVLISKAQLAQSASKQELAALNLKRAKIIAPVNGLISAKAATVGAIANASSEPMFQIIKDNKIELDAQVMEKAMSAVSIGDAAQLTISGIGSILGNVRWIAPTVDPITRLGSVKIALPANSKLRSGLFASGSIEIDQHDGLMVPATAILTQGNTNYVMVIENETIVKKPIEPGLIWKDKREILSGLKKGEVVVTRAGAFLSDGDNVKILLPSDASSAGDNQ